MAARGLNVIPIYQKTGRAMAKNRYAIKVKGSQITFRDLKDVMAKATPLRSGDQLAGLAADNAQERAAAQMVLANIPLRHFLATPLIPYEVDEVTRLVIDTHDGAAFAPIADKTVGEFRDWLLKYETDSEVLAGVAPGITPEMAAAVSKIMSNQDLVLVASKCRVITQFRNTIGLPGRMSVRLQPNHPTDDTRGIKASILDGLLHGCGDAVIGINPATDNVDSVCRILGMLDEIIDGHKIPTQSCVLTHVTTQVEAIRRGAPLDLVFQSIAGTEAANKGFGINLAMLAEAREAALSLNRGTHGNNVMYFETGQGSCLSAQAHHGIDQQTLEARAYAVARHYEPLLVNTVVGFIGPEYLYDGKQITRAGLEDHFCGKLMGVPMGVDACYTNHAEADQNDNDSLISQLALAGCTYFMGVPGADDIMLGYQSTSFHDMNYLRQVFGLRAAPEFDSWLQKMAITSPENHLLKTSLKNPLFNIVSDGVSRQGKNPWKTLRQHTAARINLGDSGSSLPTKERLKFQMDHATARDAVAQPFDADCLEQEIRKALGVETLRVTTQAKDKDVYKLRPDLGRRLSDESRAALKSMKDNLKKDFCIVVSDGLSAPAAHKQVVPMLQHFLRAANNAGWTMPPVIIASQARVWLQDEIGEILKSKMAVILLGERPGLSSPDSLGAYMVYGPAVGNRDEQRNCISNIRPEGLSHKDAADTLFFLMEKSFKSGFSGVNLKDDRVLGGPN